MVTHTFKDFKEECRTDSIITRTGRPAWTKEELRLMKDLATAIQSGELLKTQVIQKFKQLRKQNKHLEGIHKDTSANQFAQQLTAQLNSLKST